MGILDEINAEITPAGRCSVGVILDALPADEAAELEAALADYTIQHAIIVRVLNARGHNMRAQRLASHRKGICVCFQ